MKTRLPENVQIKIGRDGDVFIAELPEYDSFTEANSISELFLMINDLILTIFDVPRNARAKIKYVPNVETERSRLLTVMTTPDVFKSGVISGSN